MNHIPQLSEYNNINQKVIVLVDMLIACQGDIIILQERCKELESKVFKLNKFIYDKSLTLTLEEQI